MQIEDFRSCFLRVYYEISGYVHFQLIAVYVIHVTELVTRDSFRSCPFGKISLKSETFELDFPDYLACSPQSLHFYLLIGLVMYLYTFYKDSDIG